MTLNSRTAKSSSPQPAPIKQHSFCLVLVSLPLYPPALNFLYNLIDARRQTCVIARSPTSLGSRALSVCSLRALSLAPALLHATSPHPSSNNALPYSLLTTRCKICTHTSTPEWIGSRSIMVPPSSSVSAALSTLVTLERVRKERCERCQTPGFLDSTCELRDLPDILIVQALRFKSE